MEIQTLGKSERFVKPHWLPLITNTYLQSNIFFCLGDTQQKCWHHFHQRLFASVRYKLLHVLEFDANRRRMSVILQTPSGNYSIAGKNCGDRTFIHCTCHSFYKLLFGLNPKGDKILFTKGAESAILPFATGGEIDKTRLHVDEFALVRRFQVTSNLIKFSSPAAFHLVICLCCQESSTQLPWQYK